MSATPASLRSDPEKSPGVEFLPTKIPVAEIVGAVPVPEFVKNPPSVDGLESAQRGAILRGIDEARATYARDIETVFSSMAENLRRDLQRVQGRFQEAQNDVERGAILEGLDRLGGEYLLDYGDAQSPDAPSIESPHICRWAARFYLQVEAFRLALETHIDPGAAYGKFCELEHFVGDFAMMEPNFSARAIPRELFHAGAILAHRVGERGRAVELGARAFLLAAPWEHRGAVAGFFAGGDDFDFRETAEAALDRMAPGDLDFLARALANLAEYLSHAPDPNFEEKVSFLAKMLADRLRALVNDPQVQQLGREGIISTQRRLAIGMAILDTERGAPDDIWIHELGGIDEAGARDAIALAELRVLRAGGLFDQKTPPGDLDPGAADRALEILDVEKMSIDTREIAARVCLDGAIAAARMSDLGRAEGFLDGIGEMSAVDGWDVGFAQEIALVRELIAGRWAEDAGESRVVDPALISAVKAGGPLRFFDRIAAIGGDAWHGLAEITEVSAFEQYWGRPDLIGAEAAELDGEFRRVLEMVAPGSAYHTRAVTWRTARAWEKFCDQETFSAGKIIADLAPEIEAADGFLDLRKLTKTLLYAAQAHDYGKIFHVAQVEFAGIFTPAQRQAVARHPERSGELAWQLTEKMPENAGIYPRIFLEAVAMHHHFFRDPEEPDRAPGDRPGRGSIRIERSGPDGQKTCLAELRAGRGPDRPFYVTAVQSSDVGTAGLEGRAYVSGQSKTPEDHRDHAKIIVNKNVEFSVIDPATVSVLHEIADEDCAAGIAGQIHEPTPAEMDAAEDAAFEALVRLFERAGYSVEDDLVFVDAA